MFRCFGTTRAAKTDGFAALQALRYEIALNVYERERLLSLSPLTGIRLNGRASRSVNGGFTPAQ